MHPKKFVSILKNNVFLIFLVAIAVFISYKNYVPNTFLTGWDTLHPEFNLKMYWGRIIDGVWQEHQGLGAVGSQAHASEIPRIAILTTLILFLKVSQLRYMYAFMMLVLGPAGVYFLIKYFLTKDNDGLPVNFAAFAGGLLYLLNLGTLQHFYVPLEMFLTHYGFLGFVLLYITRYFDFGRRKDLILFGIFSILIAPQAHTSTLFFAYFLILAAFLFCLSLTYILKKINTPRLVVNRAGLITVLTLALNSFWLLPNIYFVINHGEEIKLSKIHHLFSTEAFLANQRFGNLESVAILKNFLFKWGEHVGNAEFGELLQEWNSHLNSFLVTQIGYAFFVFIVIGLTVALVTKQKYGFAVAGVFFTAMFFLFNLNPPLGFLFDFFQKNIPLFQEAFRFPFTKFSIALMLSYSVFFGYFFYYVLSILYKIKTPGLKEFLITIILFSVPSSLYMYMKPAFRGDLISPSMKVNIPNRYFELFDYLNKEERFGRVANLPIHSFWGWEYYNWDPATELGYQGAGFLWFGIKQPLMDREFDRWNLLNEVYYMEMSTAVYSQDPQAFKNVLEKYKIRWVLLDESILAPGTDQTQLYFAQIKEIISKIPEITLSDNFGSGLELFEYKPGKDFVLMEKTPAFHRVKDSIFKEAVDPIYQTFGNYIDDGSKVFPFLGITNYDETIKNGYIVSYDRSLTFVNKDLVAEAYSYENNVAVPYGVFAQFDGDKVLIVLKDDVSGNEFFETFEVGDITRSYLVKAGDEIFYLDLKALKNEKVLLGKLFITPGASLNLDIYKTSAEVFLDRSTDLVLESCSGVTKNSSYIINRSGRDFVITARNNRACATVALKDLLGEFVLDEGDIVSVSLDNENFLPGKNVCVFNSERGLCENILVSNNTNYFVARKPSNEYFLRFFSDGRGVDNAIATTYSNVRVGLLTKLESLYIKTTVSESGPTVLVKSLIFVKNPMFVGNVSNLLSDPRPCEGEKDELNYVIKKDGDGILYSSVNQRSVCDSYSFPSFNHSTGLVLEIESKNISGSPMRVCLTNESSKRCDLYIELPPNKERQRNYYMVSPMGSGFGYTVNISNSVFGEETSTNALYYVGLTQIPYAFIKSLHSGLVGSQMENENLLIYNQAFEKGWVALCGGKICDAKHVLVNNWANGWVFTNDFDISRIKVVFWPQILEYFGLGITVVSLFLCFRGKKPENQA